MPKPHTAETAREKLAQLAPHLSLVDFVPPSRGKSTFFDLRHNTEFQYDFKNLCNKVKKHPDFVFCRPREEYQADQSQSKEQAQEKLDKLTSNFKIVEYVSQKRGMSTFEDLRTGEVFQYGFQNFIKLVKEDPDYEYGRKFVPEPKKISMEEAQQKLDEVSSGYKLLEYVPSKLGKCRFQEIDSGREFEYHFFPLLNAFRRNPDYIPCPEEGVKKKIDDSRREKIEKTLVERYGVRTPSQLPNFRDKLVKRRVDNGFSLSYKGKTVSEWSDELGLPYGYVSGSVQKYGIEIVENLSRRYTYLEMVVKSFLDRLDLTYLQDKQLPGSSYRPDFVLPEHSIVIECDGLYWHSDVSKNKNNYHKKKLEKYEELGYKALFFREDEIMDRFSIVESIIKNSLNMNEQKIFARKCSVEKISPVWFSDRHLMGSGAGKCFGLVHEGKVVAGIQIKWDNKSDLSAEISRFCTELETTVVGGFSKLIKHSVNEFGCKELKTFIDRRYGKGEYLESLGFLYECCHLSFKWTDYQNTYGRMTYKHNSGYEKGLSKIWDCGQAKYVLYL